MSKKLDRLKRDADASYRETVNSLFDEIYSINHLKKMIAEFKQVYEKFTLIIKGMGYLILDIMILISVMFIFLFPMISMPLLAPIKMHFSRLSLKRWKENDLRFNREMCDNYKANQKV